MLNDLKGKPQPLMGTQPHWKMLVAAMLDPAIYGPILSQVSRVISEAEALDPLRPQINSREAGADALEALGSDWHAEFARQFPRFPSGAARGVFGMALWYHIVSRPELWFFSGVADPSGYGQNATQYWRS